MCPKVILQIDTSRACGRGILLGISKYCHNFSHWRISETLPSYFDEINGRNPNLPNNWLADGLIVGSGDVPEYIAGLGIPIIGIDIRVPIPGMPNIIGDASAIAEMALKHFVEHNFSFLAYCEFKYIPWALERGKYFIKYAKEKGYDATKYSISKQKQIFDDEVCALATWLNKQPRPLGLLSCNDDCAKIVISACETVGIRIPEDIAILGVDNDEMVCLPIDPPLSSISLDFETAGFEAARLLDKLMRGQEKLQSQQIILRPTHIKNRKSTDIFAVNDPEIHSALVFIRDHSSQFISVPNVVDATTLSRRNLECRFKAVLDQTINQVIRSHRTKRVSEMLIETDLPISQIAYMLGFTDVEHISRYFKKEKKICPSEFRRKYRKCELFR